jgi:hypothetical protein
MTISAEESLTQCLHEAIAAHSFKRVEIQQAESVPIIAAWKRNTLNMNRGIALVRFSSQNVHPGEFAKAIKKPVGKIIGYIPVLHELGLQLILVGQDVLDKSTELDHFLDSKNTQTVILQSIHLIDVAAMGLLGNFPTDVEVESDIALPGWAKSIELIGKIRAPWSGGFQRGKARLRYSIETGYAAISVRTWGQTRTGPFIDAIEDGINRFIHQGNIEVAVP